MPSIFGLLSRPLRELPTPFLWAMMSLRVLQVGRLAGCKFQVEKPATCQPATASDDDFFDLHAGQWLAMAGLAAIPLLRGHLENDDLVALVVLGHGGDDARTGDGRCPDPQL